MGTATSQASPRFEHDNAGRDRHDCTHPGSPHRHGTRSRIRDGRLSLHSVPSSQPSRRTSPHGFTAQRLLGALVDAAHARGHLQLLRQHGVGLDQIVKISEHPKRTIRRVLREPPDIAPPNPVGNSPTSVGHSALPRAPVRREARWTPRETHCRIEMLVEAGHSIPELARALGKSSVSLRRTLNRRTVTAQTALSVSNLYDRIHPSPLDGLGTIGSARGSTAVPG